MMPAVTFGSLFSGIGGFDLGFEQAGMSCQWQVEIDAKAQAILDRHWPEVRKFGDIRNVGQHNLRAADVICGGFPCQDLSVAGKRAGLSGRRSGLWFEFHRVIKELRPRWVVIENVPGLLSSNRGRDFAALLQGLEELRYSASWRVLDAQYFGVAQRRRRVFIVASPERGRSEEILFEREGRGWHPAPSRKTRQETSERIEQRAFGGNRTSGQIEVSTACNAHDRGGRMDFETETFCRAGFGVRRLMPSECERLQGFPENWTEGQSDSVRYQQIGNAVAVPVARWIGKRLVGRKLEL